MRPDDSIPAALRERLDAAREHLHVSIEWIERGDPRCYGRDFGFWDVRAGPDGWQFRPPSSRRYGEAADPDEDRGPCSVQWTDLPSTISRALDLAEHQVSYLPHPPRTTVGTLGLDEVVTLFGLETGAASTPARPEE